MLTIRAATMRERFRRFPPAISEFYWSSLVCRLGWRLAYGPPDSRGPDYGDSGNVTDLLVTPPISTTTGTLPTSPAGTVNFTR